MPVLKTLVALFCICIAVAIGFMAFAWRSAIDPIAVRSQHFPSDLVRRGAALAALGDCNTCHTAPGGRAFAGGRAVATPFGTIYATNITPDAETGIGRWSEAAFRRALHEGVDRAGRQLYPAFPYDHFTLVTDDDVHALYAYVMTRDPVHATAPGNDLAFPFNIRPLLAGWKLLYFRKGRYQPNPQHSAEWNRGAYLVEGLAHCGACHTPRGVLGAEREQDRFGGGDAEGWAAYALDQASPAPVHWNEAALVSYLRNGWHEAHGVAHGPMAAVIDDLGSIPDADIAAIADYMKDIVGTPSEQQRLAGDALVEQSRQRRFGSKHVPKENNSVEAPADAQKPGAILYQAACADCHTGSRPLPFGGLDLALSTGPSAPDPRNVINVVLWGLPAADGRRSPIMPGFANALTDRQLADLIGYVRAKFSNKPPWANIDKDIQDARTGVSPVEVYPAPAIELSRMVAAQAASQHEKQ
jgi:mono/diheme cytochrome c family protein